MPQHFQINKKLSADDRAMFKDLIRDNPGMSIDEQHAWLVRRGYTDISRSAVWRFRVNFEEIVEKGQWQAEACAAMGSLAERVGIENIAAGTISTLQQQLFDWVSLADDTKPRSAKEWSDITKAVKTLVGANADNKRLERELAEYKEKTEAAIEAASKAAQSGAGGAAVVEAIKRAMGITCDAGGAA